MERIALFAGSFDPITKGHENIVSRAAPLFDKIIVAIGENAQKKYMFSLEQRIEFLSASFKDFGNVEIATYKGLTSEFAKQNKAKYLLRGLRNSADFLYENSVAQANRKLNNELETVFFLTDSDLSFISSSIVRDVIKNNGDYSLFVPDAVRIH